MPGNKFGTLFSLSTFGESHGAALGVTIEGVPAGLEISWQEVAAALARRKPGQSALTTPRNEPEEMQILSGERDGKTLGSPLTIIIYNRDQKSKDYAAMQNVFRPSHADYAYFLKYGIAPQPGGGRASARETAARVIAGDIARQILQRKFPQTKVSAFVTQVAHLREERSENKIFEMIDRVDETRLRALPGDFCQEAEKLIERVRLEGDTVGGIVRCLVRNPPLKLGEPVFQKLEAVLAHAMMSLPAARGFDIGSGFGGVERRGSEQNDQMCLKDNQASFKTNHSGGIQGGISVGPPIDFRVAFKPVSTLFKEQETLTTSLKPVVYRPQEGRHDPCVLPRAVPVVEAMTWIVLTDAWLQDLCGVRL